MSDYKSYLLCQLGIKESRLKSSVDDPYKDIDPNELEKGSDEEKKEHDMSPEKAQKTAMDHLGEPNQRHYYTGVDKAKDMGMLKEKMPPFSSLMSPTAKSPAILAIGVRGTPGGIMPTSLAPSDTAIAPEGAGVDVKSKAALGGLELVSSQTPNSTVVDNTPQNTTINSAAPIADIVPPTPANEHPSQVQQVDGAPVQALTGTSADDAAPMGDKPDPEQFEVEDEDDLSLKSAMPKGVDVDVPNEEGEEETTEDEEENMHMVKEEILDEGHKPGCECGFCKNKGSFGKKKDEDKDEKETELDETFARHKHLMREKLGIEETKAEECKTCRCDKLNTIHDKKTKKLTTERLKSLHERFIQRSKKTPLNEQELEISRRIISTLKSRGV